MLTITTLPHTLRKFTKEHPTKVTINWCRKTICTLPTTEDNTEEHISSQHTDCRKLTELRIILDNIIWNVLRRKVNLSHWILTQSQHS